MKGKAFAVSMLILLLFAMLPMAVMAKPLRETAYTVTGCDESGCTVKDGRVGSVTISYPDPYPDGEYTISYSFSKLEPNTAYNAYIMDPLYNGYYPNTGQLFGTYTTDARGRTKGSGVYAGGYLGWVEDFSNGEFLGLQLIT